MKETKFTKGEWKIVTSKAFDDDMGEIGETTHLVIGSRITAFTHSGIAGTPADYDEQIANAHLIKTAPKLYEILQKIYDDGLIVADEKIEDEIIELLTEARGE